MTDHDHAAALHRAVALFGSQAAFARAIKVSPQHVNKLLKGGYVEPRLCKRIETACDARIAELRTKGAQEDAFTRVTRHDLCPELFDAPCADCPIRHLPPAPPDAMSTGM